MWVKIFVYTFGSILCLVLLGIAVFGTYRIFKIEGVQKVRGITPPGGIEAIEKIQVGGIEQWIFIRGQKVDNPVLLFLHGGPGKPETPYMYKFQNELEKRMTVVHWEQRGAGKSFSKNIPLDSFNIAQFQSDAYEIVQLLKKRFHKDKIFILGHSWGTMLGLDLVKKYPTDIAAYIGMGQAVEMTQAQQIGLTKLLEIAEKQQNKKAIRELTALGSPPFSLSEMPSYFKWLMAFGGEVYGESGYGSLVIESYFSPDYSIGDHMKWMQGMSSGELMYEQLLKFNATQMFPKLEVPLYFLVGRHDLNTPADLVSQYYGTIESPHKEIIWFEHSAHSPNLEEPEKFQHDVIRIVAEHSKARERL